MSHASTNRFWKTLETLNEYSAFLIAGAIAALIWANVAPDQYEAFKRFDFSVVWSGSEGTHHTHSAEEEGHHSVWTIISLANNSVMAFFFLLAAKEVFESFLPGGALSSPRKAATPLIATAGGIVGPAGLYLVGAFVLGKFAILSQGWAIPCATDIVFSYLVARIVFGRSHPAVAFLLLLAIADDAAGLAIIAICYPQGDLQLWWLSLIAVGMIAGFGMQRCGVKHWFWYVLVVGAPSWWGMHLAGLHAALGLVPIVVTMPHAKSDVGLFMRKELDRHDALNEMEHAIKPIVDVALLLFGLANAGVPIQGFGAATVLVLFGLLIGKPIGIVLFTWIGQRVLGVTVPEGMNYRQVWLLGYVAGFGFTVALFMVPAALGEHPVVIQNAAKFGALGSAVVLFTAPALGRLLGIRKSNSSKAESVLAAE